MFKFIKQYTLAEFVLFLILISLPLPEHWNSKALILALIYFLYQFYKHPKIDFPKMGFLYLLFILSAGISYFWSEDKTKTLTAVVRLLPILLLVLGYKQIFSFHTIGKVIRATSIVYLFYGLFWLILAFIRYSSGASSETFFYHQLTAPFNANAIYIALIFGMLYIILLFRILFDKNNRKIVEIVLAVLLLAFQIALSSKLILSLLLSISIFLLISYFLKTKNKRSIFLSFIVLSIFLIGLGASSYTKERFQKILDLNQVQQVYSRTSFGPGYYWNGLTLRLFQLRCFYEIENSTNFNSTLGTGFNASQSVLNEKYAQYNIYHGQGSDNKGYFIYNFHNQYAQTLIELGILGALLILVMLYFLLISPLQKKNLLLFSIGLLLISFALTESYLLRQKGIVSFVLFPILIHYSTNNKPELT
jgi:O-antigen ligase